METGNFGKLAQKYNQGRKGIPKEAIEYLWSFSPLLNQRFSTLVVVREL